MSTNQMDYFDQKPKMDLKPFFEAKGIKMDKAVVPIAGAAPPPKDTAWVAPDTPINEEPE